MSPLLRDIFSGMTVLALAAGSAGVLMAVKSQADVVALKEAQPQLEERLRGVEQSVTALETATTLRAEADKEHRDALRNTLGALDRKLDTLVGQRTE